MGMLQNSIDALKNAIGDLFPEEQPSATLLFPTTPLPAPTPIPAPIGKITSYNWKGDPYTDTNSRNMVGSFGKLSNEGMAISPDIEKKFREAGIKPKDKVEITLSDGTNLVRKWEDRTMQDKQAIKKYGKPLTGRFDLNFPEGNKPHEKDGIQVVGFRKLE